MLRNYPRATCFSRDFYIFTSNDIAKVFISSSKGWNRMKRLLHHLEKIINVNRNIQIQLNMYTGKPDLVFFDEIRANSNYIQEMQQIVNEANQLYPTYVNHFLPELEQEFQ